MSFAPHRARLSPFVTVVALCSKAVCGGRTPRDRLQFVAPNEDHLSHGARANESVEERHIPHGLGLSLGVHQDLMPAG
jgi:hypothetical protein